MVGLSHRIHVVLVGAALSMVALLPSAALADPAPDDGLGPRDGVPGDAAAAQLYDRAVAAGALGAYVADDGTYVLAVSPDATLPADDLERFGVPFKVVTRDITTEDIERIKSALVSLARDLPKEDGWSFGAGFDARAGVVRIQGNAPARYFQAVIDAFDGKVAYKRVEGAGERLSRVADTAPHWGERRLTVHGVGARVASRSRSRQGRSSW